MRSWVLALAFVLVAGVLPACGTRSVNETVVETYDLEIRLRSEKPAFGFKTIARGFGQPVEISPARLESILGGIQIDLRPSEKSALRERRYAIPRKVLPEIARGLSGAFAEAGPDQEIVVLALRKQMQKGFFNRKYLTSFVTWVENGALVVQLSRIDWKTEQHRKRDKLPTPAVGDFVMPFSTVASGAYTKAGRQGVTVDWRSDAFGTETIEQNVAGQRTGADALADDAPDAGGSTAAGSAEAAPSAAGTAGAAGAEAQVEATREAEESTDALRGLTADHLRRLADLEDARASGRIDASEYEVQRRAILDSTR